MQFHRVIKSLIYIYYILLYVYVHFILSCSSNITKTAYEKLFLKFYNENSRNIVIYFSGDGDDWTYPILLAQAIEFYLYIEIMF